MNHIAANSDDSMVFLYKGKSLRVPKTFVMKEHPGGKQLLLPYEGKDIAEAFAEADHSFDAKEMLEEWEVGVSATEAAARKERAEKRYERIEHWRWQSTAIAFGVATIVAAFVLRPSRN